MPPLPPDLTSPEFRAAYTAAYRAACHYVDAGHARLIAHRIAVRTVQEQAPENRPLTYETIRARLADHYSRLDGLEKRWHLFRPGLLPADHGKMACRLAREGEAKETTPDEQARAWNEQIVREAVLPLAGAILIALGTIVLTGRQPYLWPLYVPAGLGAAASLFWLCWKTRP